MQLTDQLPNTQPYYRPFSIEDAIAPIDNWEMILQTKQDFIDNNIDPTKSPYIRKVIADSWLRSRAYGVNPHSKITGKVLSTTEKTTLLTENAQLIAVAIPIIKNFTKLLKLSGYMITLRDKHGFMLLKDGNQYTVDEFSTFNSIVGGEWTEASGGTCAHILCMHHRKPIQLIGPENYCMIFQNNMTSSAPIFNNCNEVIGTFTIVSNLDTMTVDEHLKQLQTHSLGWVSFIAFSTGQQLRLNQNYNKLLISKNILKTALEINDVGVILLNSAGEILTINTTALHILNLPNESAAVKYNFFKFLTADSQVMTSIKSQNSLNYVEETLQINNSDQTFIISLQPIQNDASDLSIIRIVTVEKINTLAIHRTGNNAQFTFNDIIGESATINKVKNICKRLANAPENILILGENGTGKELFAQAIHNSSRPKGPFIALNCAAMPRNLIESELFGYEGGSFTGAERTGRPGKIELANGGTLFLDEIGDMPFELQAILLRVLQDKKVMRIGGKRYNDINFRLIAATNQNLTKMVEEKAFRADLYYRLSVLKMQIPPLRQRENDPLLLSNYFIKTYCKKQNIDAPVIAAATGELINKYPWPGNVRQLENAIIYAINICLDNVILPEHLPDEISQKAILPNPLIEQTCLANNPENISLTPPPSIETLEESEIYLIHNALKKTNNNVIQAAKILKISKSTLYRKLKEYNIQL